METTESGRQALELADSSAPDAIVLDVSMPGLSGIEVCERQA
ncbi:response regulator [Sphaerisporangium flaviroseum]